MRENLENAIRKARQVRCRVRLIGGRAYLVVTPQDRKYTVRFEEFDGQRYGRCNCKAGAAGMACYHLPKAALVDSGIQNMRSH